MVKKSVSSGAVSPIIKRDAQARHCETTRIDGRSYLYGDIHDAQRLIDELSTTGEPVYDENCNWTRKERVSSDRIIGLHVDDTTGETSETRKAMIHYSKRGAHIMPRKDNDDD